MKLNEVEITMLLSAVKMMEHNTKEIVDSNSTPNYIADELRVELGEQSELSDRIYNELEKMQDEPKRRKK